ncbi:MAG: hypothetical protein V3R67_07910 [Thermodesulfobacteriota bacterium]
MSGILLDINGDLDITNGNITLTTGVVATKQRLQQKFRLFAEEWFLDKSRGLPYFTQMFVKNPNPVILDALFKREIITDPAVIELQEFDLTLDGSLRTLTLTFKALTEDGVIDFTEPFSI